jgi:putative aldouronate transport system permease protein
MVGIKRRPKALSRQTPGEIAVKSIIVVSLSFLTIITLYPFWYILVASFSDPYAVVRRGGMMLWVEEPGLYAYREVFRYRLLWTAYRNTIIYLTVGLSISMTLTVFAAYALSRKDLKGTGVMMKIIVFTMFFTGGMIPTYLVVDGLGMIDTIWSQVIPHAINTFNLIVLRTAFKAVPDSIEEAASIDGAQPPQIMFRIIIPLAMPAIMVIGLYYAVELWNTYFRALLYLKNQDKYPLQMALRQILIQGDAAQKDMGFVDTNIQETVKYATIMVSTIPILMVYPFIQKYFVKGVMIGSIKG